MNTVFIAKLAGDYDEDMWAFEHKEDAVKFAKAETEPEDSQYYHYDIIELPIIRKVDE